MSLYLRNKIQNYIFLKGDVTLPNSFYLGLSKTAPTQNGTNITEPTNTDYARVEITRSSIDFSTSTVGEVKNKLQKSFNEALTVWGNCTHYVIFDAAQGGNPLYYGELERARNIDIEMQLIINPNDLSFALN